jgi:hypothetical protein
MLCALFWWTRSRVCHLSAADSCTCGDDEDDGTDTVGRGQNTACPSVPAVTSSVGERKEVCVRQDVAYMPRARGRQRGVRVGVYSYIYFVNLTPYWAIVVRRGRRTFTLESENTRAMA